MVHLFTFATFWFDFRQKQRFFLSQYIYKLKMRSLYGLWIVYLFKYVLLWFNSEPTTTERCKFKGTFYIYTQWTFSNAQVFLNNVATTIKFFENQCVIFLQLFKCASVVLTCDYLKWRRRGSIRNWFLELKVSLRKLRFFPPNVQISVFAVNRKLKSIIDC